MTTQQIKFRTIYEEEFFGGILIDKKYFICGCCGGVFEGDEIEEYKPLSWVNISEEIKGE